MTAGGRLLLAAVLAGTTALGASASSTLPVQGKAPFFDGATVWLNSRELAAGDLRGKVVLVEFGTYTCINWLRTLPYVRAWAEKYRDRGLVVVGVHTPEFPFEKDLDNVRRAVRDMRIGFPLAVDSEFAIWRAFRNNAWPAFYFVDAQGRIRHQQSGEGDYDRAERVLQQLLAETGATGVPRDLVSVEGRGVEAAADWDSLRSPENYLGSDRTANFASPGGRGRGERRVYAIPAHLPLNHWALGGDWTMQTGSIVLNQAGGRIAYRFHARDLHLVMGPAARGASVRFRVLIDGRPPGEAQGLDVDARGHGTVTEQRLYQLVRQPKPVADRTLEIEFLERGAEAFAFTFG